MAFAPRYATVQDLRDSGIPQSVLDDASARIALDEISRWVESENHQIYYPLTQTIYLDGQDHRILSHPDLWPILSAEGDIVITLLTERTRRYRVVDWYDFVSTTTTIDDSDYSLDTNHPRRKIEKHFGNWFEGSHNYSVEAVWGWLNQVAETDYTLTAAFDTDDTELELDSVNGLRRHDVGVLPDGTMLTIVAVDRANSKVIVEGGDLVITGAVIGNTFTRWGQVPGGVRDFVVAAIYMNSGINGSGGCPWIKRERTDWHEYEKFSPEETGMDGGDWWTGNPMIDQGLRRYRRPQYAGLI